MKTDYIKIIPCLDIKDGRVVKGIQFVNLKDAGDPAENAARYCEEGADEIAFLDITATVQGRKTMVDVVKKVVKVINVPLTVGGGVASLDDAKRLVDAGVSRISISSAGFRNPSLLKEVSDTIGRENTIAAIDVDRNPDLPSGYEVYIDGGTTATGKDALEFAVESVSQDIGQILPTSKAADGTTEGYDLKITRMIADATGLPVIASGGAGKLEDFYLAVIEGHASAVLAASVFHFCIFSIREVKEYLKSKGIAVNL